jgi:hypothetical protein
MAADHTTLGIDHLTVVPAPPADDAEATVDPDSDASTSDVDVDAARER